MQSNLALEAVEKLLAEVSSAMLAGDPVALEKGSAQLRQAVADFSRVMEGMHGQPPLPVEMAARIQRISEQLTVQRDNLARVTALVDRQVASILPQVDTASTYGKTGAGPGGAVARIYRSTG